MPEVLEHQTQRIIPQDQVKAYLNDHDVHYEYWPVDALPLSLRERKTLSDEDKSSILEVFHDQLARISAERGYISHDVIVLNGEGTPNLEELLRNFERTHHHTEDEVRFIVDGEGIFTLTRGGDTFSITVRAGDLISVPTGTEHYFTLTSTRDVKAIRLFQSADGWVAIYAEDVESHGAR